jgi:preprotein translocase subunit SecG
MSLAAVQGDSRCLPGSRVGAENVLQKDKVFLVLLFLVFLFLFLVLVFLTIT